MNPMFAAMKGTAMKDKKKRAAAGGGTASVSMATTSSGNFDNAIKLGIRNNQTNAMSFSGGVTDGSADSFGTATSPARTTQAITLQASDYLNSWNANGTGNGDVVIGGYIRHNNYSSPNKDGWAMDANTIQSQSFATGVQVTVAQTNNAFYQLQDNTTISTGGPYGIYSNLGSSSNSGFYRIIIQHASGRGAATLPQPGDNFTFRLSVFDVNGSTPLTAIHDVTVTWA